MKQGSAEEILDKWYKPKMHWPTVNRKNVLAAMEEYAKASQQNIIEAEAEKLLVKLMQDEPVKTIQWMLVQLGKQMVEANAARMTVKTESTLDGKRYKVECVAKLSKINK